MRFAVYRRLTYRQGAFVFGGAGLVMLAAAAYMTWRGGVELLTWPRVEAHVDTADVLTIRGVHGLVYAARLRLAYSYGGQNYRTSATVRQEWPDYSFAAEDAARAVGAGRVVVMLDPDRPGAPDPRMGSMGAFVIIPLAIALLGLVFAAFGGMALRVGRRVGLDRLTGSNEPGSPRVAAAWLAGMGTLFVIGAVIAAVLGPQGASWTPVQGRIESADVLEVSRGMYAVQTWFTYTLDGRTYRAPVTANTSRNDFAAVSRLAGEAEQSHTAALLVDPSHPNRVVTAGVSRAEGIVLPAAFGLVGIVLIGIAVLIRRHGLGRRRFDRSGPSVISPV
jgi:hypothetical protein